MDLLKLLRDKDTMCTGCGACNNVCPKSAIEMEEDGEGFLYPSIDSQKCINCRLCERTCPCLNTKYKNSSNPDCYAMMASDEERKTSSSGGFVSVVARWVLRNGGVVFGAAYDGDWRVNHIAIENEDDLLKIKSSKYLQSDVKYTYKEAIKELKNGRWVLYTGTPCQIAGMYAALGNVSSEKLITIDILCHGTPSYKVFRKYLEANYEVENLKSFDFRDKSVFGWSTTSNAYYKDGREVHIPTHEDYYYRSFLPCMSMRPSCRICPMSRLPRQGDYTAGDFWGMNRYNKSFNDRKGTSMILVNSNKGKSFINNIVQDFKLWEKVPIDYATHINKTILHPFRSHAGRKHFFSSLDLKPFNQLVEDSLSHHYDVGIVGLWYGKNYGSILTYYALYSVLRDLGYDPVMLPKPNNLWDESFNRQNTIAQKFIWERCNVFLPCRIQEEYPRFNDLCRDFVIGSDVVWKYSVCGKDSGHFFFLDWVECGHKKIAFASSVGQDKLSGPHDYVVKGINYLKKMDALSCRESQGVELLTRITKRKDVVQVLDPVFLCDPQNYITAIGNNAREKGPVVFAYILNRYMIAQKVDLVHKAAEHFGVPYRVCANPNAHETIKDHFPDAMPVISVNDWLYYMKNCSFYIGDSFHGLCFALIFHKPFIALTVSNELRKGRVRFESILKLVGLEDRLLDNLDDPSVYEALLDKPIDWDSVDERLKELKSFSIDWLKEKLSEKKPAPTLERQIADQEKRRLNECLIQLYDQRLRIEKLEGNLSGPKMESGMKWLVRRGKDVIRSLRKNGVVSTYRIVKGKVRDYMFSK